MDQRLESASGAQAPRSVDVLIVGAGLSGIGIAARLSREDPARSLAILERRTAIGGTWDLFRYPGVRSDSDMLTFGYDFRPWVGTKILADGPSIRSYIEDTAVEYDVADQVHFGRHVTRLSWSSQESQWTVTATVDGQNETWTARFLVLATGYYSYDEGFRPDFPGEADFGGQIVHPQFWPQDLDYAGKQVVIIGSGATAVTLVPAMTPTAGHVTMLQRSPTYILPVPESDPVASPLAKVGLRGGLLYGAGRRRNIALQQALYKLCRSHPRLARRIILGAARAQLRGKVDMVHFTPSYNPWDERLCVVPNGDLFRVLRRGEASIVTDHIDTFTPTGIRTRSGQDIPADIVVSATGLQIQIAGGAALEVDGEHVSTRERMLYRGVLLEGVPNLAVIMGYTNASWTLKADLAGRYLCRLLAHLDEHDYAVATPQAAPADRADVSVMGDSMRSGYIRRGDAVMPRQGNEQPWRILNDYTADRPILTEHDIADEVLLFARATDRAKDRAKDRATDRAADRATSSVS